MSARALALGLAVSLAGLLPVTGADAQTPITAVGLGYPVPPVDARAAALGGTGIGLLGAGFSLRNPADMTEHRFAGISSSFAPEASTVEGPDRSSSTGRNRFSVVRAVVPMGDWWVGFGFGSVLDQDWNLQVRDTLILSQGQFPFEEDREHNGGVSAIDFSLARQIGPLSLGASGQRLTGVLRQSFVRRFEPPLEPGRDTLRSTGDQQQLSYGGWRLTGGASVRAGNRVMLGGAVSWASDLDVQPTGADEPTRSYDMPVSVDLGGSARLTRNLLLTAGGGWTGWSSVGEVQPGVVSHDASWVGGGLELMGWRLIGVEVPLRLGARRAELPFAPQGFEQPVERALTGGFGARIRGGLAQADLALEVGKRGELATSGLEESFRRVTLTFTVGQ